MYVEWYVFWVKKSEYDIEITVCMFKDHPYIDKISAILRHLCLMIYFLEQEIRIRH